MNRHQSSAIPTTAAVHGQNRPPPECNALTFDVGGSSVTQLDRGLYKRNFLKVPAPSYVDLRAKHDPTVRYARAAAALGGPRRDQLLRGRQPDPKRLARHAERHHRDRRWGRRSVVTACCGEQRRESQPGREPEIRVEPHGAAPPAAHPWLQL